MGMHPVDRMPQGDPETVVLLPTGSLIGLHIRGVDAPTMLGIREDADGQPVSCAITTELHISYPPVQSNPRRDSDFHKGWVEE